MKRLIGELRCVRSFMMDLVPHTLVLAVPL